MKNCLITGGGSKFGSNITDQLLASGYQVYLITGSQTYLDNPNVVTIQVNWKTLSLANLRSIILKLPELDLIFFNHNSSALSQTKFLKNQLQSFKDWQQNYFVACQFPFYLIHALKDKISEKTKIGWMLSSLIKHPTENQIGFADYIGNKFTNGCIMKSFSQNFPGIFFGINPESVSDNATNPDLDVCKAADIVHLINTHPDLNGKIYYSNGELFNF
jgi:hypothetical protein